MKISKLDQDSTRMLISSLEDLVTKCEYQDPTTFAEHKLAMAYRELIQYVLREQGKLAKKGELKWNIRNTT